ncbi:TEPSIN isoform 1 [Pan troglodytes]|uniref:TEPSIN isoform 1 n=1 Tax=Pan troglodytes TaxID=9598 RepID=A0A2J8JGB7_PANTR|nr:TEPSIN isoform 1 [Pan troglodytes]
MAAAPPLRDRLSFLHRVSEGGPPGPRSHGSSRAPHSPDSPRAGAIDLASPRRVAAPGPFARADAPELPARPPRRPRAFQAGPSKPGLPSRAFQAGPAERKGDGHSQTLGERTGLGQHSVASDGREGAADPVDVEPLCPCCWRPGGLAARRPP